MEKKLELASIKQPGQRLYESFKQIRRSNVNLERVGGEGIGQNKGYLSATYIYKVWNCAE